MQKEKKKLAEGGRAEKLMDDSVRKEYIQCDFLQGLLCICVCLWIRGLQTNSIMRDLVLRPHCLVISCCLWKGWAGLLSCRQLAQTGVAREKKTERNTPQIRQLVLYLIC